MTALIGFDAAWSAVNPSGVAVVVRDGSCWRLLSAFSTNETLNSVVAQATQMAGKQIDLICADIPLAPYRIVHRRPADDAISLRYGSRWAGTHSPTAKHPEPVSTNLREAAADLGFILCARGLTRRSLIECYPHPALIELTNADRRLPYKVTKVVSYWPNDNPETRHRKLREVWDHIVDALDRDITDAKNLLLPPAPGLGGKALKAYEDKLDAVVCALVGICALEGRAEPFGDELSSIWVPKIKQSR